MADENSNPTEEPAEGEDLSNDNQAPSEGPDKEKVKGGADGKTKVYSGKELGDYVKTDKSERAYE